MKWHMWLARRVAAHLTVLLALEVGSFSSLLKERRLQGRPDQHLPNLTAMALALSSYIWKRLFPSKHLDKNVRPVKTPGRDGSAN